MFLPQKSIMRRLIAPFPKVDKSCGGKVFAVGGTPRRSTRAEIARLHNKVLDNGE
jgi:hypothetical protein